MAVIAVARSLRLEVVAEGVETEEQRVFLRDQGCNLMQGYYLSKPLSAGDFEAQIFTRPDVGRSPNANVYPLRRRQPE